VYANPNQPEQAGILKGEEVESVRNHPHEDAVIDTNVLSNIGGSNNGDQVAEETRDDPDDIFPDLLADTEEPSDGILGDPSDDIFLDLLGIDTDTRRIVNDGTAPDVGQRELTTEELSDLRHMMRLRRELSQLGQDTNIARRRRRGSGVPIRFSQPVTLPWPFNGQGLSGEPRGAAEVHSQDGQTLDSLLDSMLPQRPTSPSQDVLDMLLLDAVMNDAPREGGARPTSPSQDVLDTILLLDTAVMNDAPREGKARSPPPPAAETADDVLNAILNLV